MNNDLLQALKVFKKFGYPNENFRSLTNMVGYNSDSFIEDLIETLGMDKTQNFIKQTIEKLEKDGQIYIPLWSEGEYVYLDIIDFNIDEDDLSCVFIEWTWGDSKILDDNNNLVTLSDLDEDNDPWDLDDFYDHLKESVSDYISKKTGFDLCWGI